MHFTFYYLHARIKVHLNNRPSCGGYSPLFYENEVTAMTMEEMQRKLEQVEHEAAKARIHQEVANVMGKYCFYHTANMWPEKNALMAWDVPGVREEGMQGVSLKPHSMPEFKADGTPNHQGFLNIHALTNPVIEVADDLKSAKGAWVCPGVETNNFKAPKGYWAWMKYAADFIPVNGEWKIYHLHAYSIFMCPYDKCWTDVPAYNPRVRDMDGNPLPEGGMGKPDPDMLKAMGLDPNEPMPEKKDDGQLPPTTPVYEYSATAVYPKDQPPMPEKYTTLSETFEY